MQAMGIGVYLDLGHVVCARQSVIRARHPRTVRGTTSWFWVWLGFRRRYVFKRHFERRPLMSSILMRGAVGIKHSSHVAHRRPLENELGTKAGSRH